MAKGLQFLKKLTKGTAIGGLTGYVSSRVTSSSAEAKENALAGAKVGAAVGASLPILGSKTFRKGVASGAMAMGSVIFKRIRGKIVPIKVKSPSKSVTPDAILPAIKKPGKK